MLETPTKVKGKIGFCLFLPLWAIQWTGPHNTRIIPDLGTGRRSRAEGIKVKIPLDEELNLIKKMGWSGHNPTYHHLLTAIGRAGSLQKADLTKAEEQLAVVLLTSSERAVHAQIFGKFAKAGQGLNVKYKIRRSNLAMAIGTIISGSITGIIVFSLGKE